MVTPDEYMRTFREKYEKLEKVQKLARQAGRENYTHIADDFSLEYNLPQAFLSSRATIARGVSFDGMLYDYDVLLDRAHDPYGDPLFKVMIGETPSVDKVRRWKGPSRTRDIRKTIADFILDFLVPFFLVALSFVILYVVFWIMAFSMAIREHRKKYGQARVGLAILKATFFNGFYVAYKTKRRN